MTYREAKLKAEERERQTRSEALTEYHRAQDEATRIYREKCAAATEERARVVAAAWAKRPRTHRGQPCVPRDWTPNK